MEVVNTLGRRKTSVARVYLKKGTGKMTVNQRDYKDRGPGAAPPPPPPPPPNRPETVGQYDVTVNVAGGGVNGQAEAIRLGISRALVKVSEDLKPALKAEGLMTRDPRMVERKKPGQPKARKKFQFSKR